MEPEQPAQEHGNHITRAQKERIARAQENALSKGSQELYRKHWRAFKKWAKQNGLSPRPADVDTVCAYLVDRADDGTAPTTLKPAISAIRHFHEKHDLTSPTTNPRVKRTIKGLAREYPRRRNQAAPLEQEHFDAILAKALTPRTHETGHQAAVRALFDLALMSFARDTAARPSEAAAAKWGHITQTSEGAYVLLIPYGKTDQTREGHHAVLTPLTIVLLNLWCMTSGRIPKANKEIFGIGPRQISNRIQAAAADVELEGRYRGQSPRIGIAVDLANENVELPAIKQVGRWKSDKTVWLYIEAAVATKNAVAERDAERTLDSSYRTDR